ncbi:hypothetical protein HDU91_006382 [Kappamyces sp. JEL0680]|nr:hypothetical protein HDU91_006382 [Kappamyces sp. JEL0680]
MPSRAESGLNADEGTVSLLPPKLRKRAKLACDICSGRRTKCVWTKELEESQVEELLERGIRVACRRCAALNLACTFDRDRARKKKRLEKLDGESWKESLSVDGPLKITDQVRPLSQTLTVSYNASNPYFTPPVSLDYASGPLSNSLAPTPCTFRQIVPDQAASLPPYIPRVSRTPSVDYAAHSDEFMMKKRGTHKAAVDWTHLDFFLLRFLLDSGKDISLIDYYFLQVYPKVPVFSKKWLLNHLGDLPLYLLHSIYAATLCLQQSRESAIDHYQFAIKRIYRDLEQSDPWTIAALVHLGYFNIGVPNAVTEIQTTIVLAIKLCHYFGVHVDHHVYWQSPIGNVMGGPESDMDKNFLRSIWISLYISEFYASTLAQLPMLIRDPIDEKVWENFVPWNSDDPSHVADK